MHCAWGYIETVFSSKVSCILTKMLYCSWLVECLWVGFCRALYLFWSKAPVNTRDHRPNQGRNQVFTPAGLSAGRKPLQPITHWLTVWELHHLQLHVCLQSAVRIKETDFYLQLPLTVNRCVYCLSFSHDLGTAQGRGRDSEPHTESSSLTAVQVKDWSFFVLD